MSEARLGLEVGDYVKVFETSRAIHWGRVESVVGVTVQVMVLSQKGRPLVWYSEDCLHWLDPEGVRDRRGPNLQSMPPRTEEGQAFQKAWAERYERALEPVVAKAEKDPEPLPMAPVSGPRCPRCAGPAYVGLLSFVCEREGGCRTPEERVQARAAAGEPGRRVKVVRERLKHEDTFIFATAYLATKRADVQMFPSYAQAEAAWRAWALAEERER